MVASASSSEESIPPKPKEVKLRIFLVAYYNTTPANLYTFSGVRVSTKPLSILPYSIIERCESG